MAALEGTGPDAVAAALSTNDDACSITTWYEAHKALTFKTVIIPLPALFIDWLGSDGPCMLPRTKRGARATARTRMDDDDCELSDAEDDGAAPHFPVLEGDVDAAVAAVGGAAFVKLNWSAPQDAAWLGPLKCESAGDVFALLAASSLVKQDVARAATVVLAVRRFAAVEASREFRCFWLDGQLVAACQRHVDTVFRDLADEVVLSEVRSRLRAFFDRSLSLPAHCVVDVVVEARSTYLVDVNVAAQRTDPLLFAWADVLALRCPAAGPRPPTQSFELRVVEGDQFAVRASAMSSFRAPMDVAAIAEAGGLDELVRRSRLDDSSSSSSDGGVD